MMELGNDRNRKITGTGNHFEILTGTETGTRILDFLEFQNVMKENML